MNLGAFAVVIAVARRTRSAEIDSYSGLGQMSPGLGGHDDDLPVLARRHPAVRRLVRQVRDVPRGVLDADTPSAIVLGVIAAVMSVVAFFYYARGRAQDVVPRPVAGARELAGAAVPAALTVAIGLTVAVVVVIGVYPQFFARVGELAFQAT